MEYIIMQYITLTSSFLLFSILLFLTGYNTLYALRTRGVNKYLGTELPSIIKRLFTATIFLSGIATLVALVVFINSIISL
ncbi:MAG TPA: hypothetical protein VG965_07170 [Patescibacteria group bacterium]|nr:hypothetical protein [Patescibacteria group bacterium]